MMNRCSSGLKSDVGILPKSMVLFLAILMTHVGLSFSLRMVASSWRTSPPSQSSSRGLNVPSSSRGLNVPTVRLSMASSRDVNSVYAPRDPNNIPTGFARMCNKAGGFAPRALWDDLTTGVSPWFESKDGCFIYFNCNDAHWYVDNASGAGMYLAVPDGSLLLPPTNGWVSLTGRRVGAPKMSFV